MRKVILFIATSLDGYIARSSGAVDWLLTDEDYGYEDFFKKVDVVVMGRKTYEQVLSFGKYPYQSKLSYVFTHTTNRLTDTEVSFVSDDVQPLIKQLQASGDGYIWLIGGAELVHSFLERDLIDEFVLSVHPILLGEGIPLFQPPSPLRTLQFQSAQSFKSGLVQLRYTRA
jgi:dihydrofolate reductase